MSTKINVIDRMIEFYNRPHSDDRLYSNISETIRNHTNISVNVQEYLTAQLDCMYQSMVHNKVECDNYDKKAEDLLKKLSDAATAMADRDDYMLNPSTRKDFLKYLKNEKEKLNEQQDKLVDMLGKLSPFMNSIRNADQFSLANISDAYKDDNWLQFSFDSKSNFRRQGSTTLSFYGATKLQLASSKMKAKGKLLRVNIKRPWFRPEVFEDSSLNFVCCLHVY